jgi:hypothetical protein
MRPNSRGTSAAPGTASGPPGTGGVRPGSGRRPPATSRLRTGMVNTGPGMQAGQGLALNASINVADRPVTGQGVMGMKVQASGTGRLVQDTAYYTGLLRKKITDITSESTKLNNEIEQYNAGQAQLGKLKKTHDALLKTKEQLEGKLADYNLALDKVSNNMII